MKSFNVTKQTKNLLNYNDYISFLIGKKIKILSNAGGHNYGAIGSIITLNNHALRVTGGSGTVYTNLNGGIVGGNNIAFSAFAVIEALSPADIKKEIKSLILKKADIDSEINICKNKLNYLEETGVKKFDENEFKAYSTLVLLDDPKLSKIEKAKIIAKMLT